MNTAPQLSDPTNTESVVAFSIPETFEISKKINSKANIDETDGNTEFEYEDSIQAPQLAPQYLKPLKGKFQLLQLWEGRITEIADNTFSAIISDKTNPDLPDELVSLDIEEVTPCDLPLLELGSVFYWSIRYADFPGHGRSKESKIRFRRLPVWTQKEINRAITTGAELASFFQRD